MGELSDSLISTLSEVLGARLDRFVVRAFAGEVGDLGQLCAPQLLVGGEVHFQFGERPLFVSWESGRDSLGFSIADQ